MGLELLKSIVYGLVTGITEFLPISSRGHQVILMQLFGFSERDPLLDMFTHIGVLIALIVCCIQLIAQMQWNRKIAQKQEHSRNVRTYTRGVYDFRLVAVASIPMIFGLFFYALGTKYETMPLMCSLFFVINGIIIFVPEYMRQGNKDASMLTGLDGFLIGLCGVFSIFPGISRVGVQSAYATARGADKRHITSWVLLLSIPVVALMIFIDFIGIFAASFSHVTIWTVLGYILSIGAGFAGAYLGIWFIRSVVTRSGYVGFAYYSWGAALFAFILNLIA